MKEFWKINPLLQKADENFRNEIKGTTAAVVIGDRALEQRKLSAYQYDLGLAWKEYTGLPFVFAAWVSNKPLSEEFIVAFDKANEEGLKNIDAVVALNPYPVFDLKKYYTDHIKFKLDSTKRQAIALFLSKLKTS